MAEIPIDPNFEQMLGEFARIWKMIDDAPESIGGHVHVADDGSVTEERWRVRRMDTSDA